MANQQVDLGTIISRNSVGPTSVFLLNENISKESSITACGVVEMCDNQCQKSLSLEGAEI